MSIGALASMIPVVGGIAQEGLKLTTELAKIANQVVSQLTKSQSGANTGDQSKIAHQDMHNNNPVQFAPQNSTNTNININSHDHTSVKV